MTLVAREATMDNTLFSTIANKTFQGDLSGLHMVKGGIYWWYVSEIGLIIIFDKDAKIPKIPDFPFLDIFRAACLITGGCIAFFLGSFIRYESSCIDKNLPHVHVPYKYISFIQGWKMRDKDEEDDTTIQNIHPCGILHNMCVLCHRKQWYVKLKC